MSDDKALLAAIIAAPDDDTPRFVLADWLDEHDQPDRAEFIRLQIERAALDPHSGRLRECVTRERELLKRNRKAWDRRFRAAVPGGQFVYRRGFIASIGTEERFYQQSFRRLLSITPLEDVCLKCSRYTSLRVPMPSVNHPLHVRFRLASLDQIADNVFVFDVLRRTPATLEPYLRRGYWVVNATGFWDSELLRGELIPNDQIRNAFRAQRRYAYAVRPYGHPNEFATWCPQVPERCQSHWYVFEDGEIVDYHAAGWGELAGSIRERLARAAGE